MKTKLLLFTFLICLIASLDAQDTIQVPLDYSTIQEGIDSATDGDVVLVDQGTYFENIKINWKAITLSSNYITSHDSIDIYNTIIDGSQPLNANLASVVTIYSTDTNTVIHGFTIRNGTGTLLTNRGGGGIICFNGGKIIHNRILDNNVYCDQDALGGGIWAEGGGSSSSIFVIRDNIVAGNHMENANSTNGCWGSGIGVYNGHVIIENNIIRYNTSTGRPYGVGLYCTRCNGTIRDNFITENSGSHTLANNSRGGGIYLVNHHTPLILSNNELTHNELIHNTVSGQEYGGGISIYNTGGYENNRIVLDKNIISQNTARNGGGVTITEIYNIELSNNVIQNNETDKYGGGIYFQNLGEKLENSEVEDHVGSKSMKNKKADFIPVLVNNTITGNISGFSGGGLATSGSEFLLFNNIIYDNLNGTDNNEIFLGGSCSAYLYNNNINTEEIFGNGTWQGEANIDVDPCFDPDDGYHLLVGSECVNAGTAMVDIEGIIYYAPEYDIDLELRPMNDNVEIGVDEIDISMEIAELHVKSDTFKLNNYPNPFTSETTINYNLQKSSNIQLSIYNQFGGEIKGLFEGYQTIGDHQLKINLSDLNPGIYYCTLQTNAGMQTKKIIKL